MRIRMCVCLYVQNDVASNGTKEAENITGRRAQAKQQLMVEVHKQRKKNKMCSIVWKEWAEISQKVKCMWWNCVCWFVCLFASALALAACAEQLHPSNLNTITYSQPNAHTHTHYKFWWWRLLKRNGAMQWSRYVGYRKEVTSLSFNLLFLSVRFLQHFSFVFIVDLLLFSAFLYMYFYSFWMFISFFPSFLRSSLRPRRGRASACCLFIFFSFPDYWKIFKLIHKGGSKRDNYRVQRF